MSYLRQVVNFLEFITPVVVHSALMNLPYFTRRVWLLGALVLLAGPLAEATELRAIRVAEGAEATQVAI